MSVTLKESNKQKKQTRKTLLQKHDVLINEIIPRKMKKTTMQPIYRYRYSNNFNKRMQQKQKLCQYNKIWKWDYANRWQSPHRYYKKPIQNSFDKVKCYIKPFNGAKKRYETVYDSVTEQKPDIAA